jgi:hypothetical protein
MKNTCCLVRCEEQTRERESFCEDKWLLDMWGVPTRPLTLTGLGQLVVLLNYQEIADGTVRCVTRISISQ